MPSSERTLHVARIVLPFLILYTVSTSKSGAPVGGVVVELKRYEPRLALLNTCSNPDVLRALSPITSILSGSAIR